MEGFIGFWLVVSNYVNFLFEYISIFGINVFIEALDYSVLFILSLYK